MNLISKTLFAVGLVCFLFSCRTDRQNINDNFHIRIKKDPERLHPLIFPNPLAREVYQYIFLPLADYDPNSLELSPILIKEIPTKELIIEGEYKGGVQYQVEIREEAVWEDGSPITGLDYIFTLKAIKLPLNNTVRYRDAIQYVSDVIMDAQNPKKFTIIFKKDNVNSLEAALNFEIYPAYFYDPNNVLSNINTGKLDSDTAYIGTLVKDSSLVSFSKIFNGNEFSSEKISGAGPYSFVSWESNQSITLTKKENYWGEKFDLPALKNIPDKIIFHIIADEVAALIQLKEGNIDLMNEVSSEGFNDLENDASYNKNFHFFTPSLMKYYLISLNNSDVKLSDKNVRKALSHLLDVDEIIKNLENGKGERLTSAIHPAKSYYNDQLKPVGYDLNLAKKLLADAGWKDSNNNQILDKMMGSKLEELTLDFYISGQELGKRVALMLQESASAAGIKINIIEKDNKLIRSEHIKKRNYHLTPSLVSLDLNHWEDLKPRWHSDSDNPAGANDVSYRNPEVDKLISLLENDYENETRIAKYMEIQKMIYDDQPVIFLYVPTERIIINNAWKASSTLKRPGYMANHFELIGQKKLNQ